MTEHWSARLSEYLDGDLGPDETAALETHLAGCAACRDALVALRAMVEQARRLPDRAPASDLWPGIAARLQPRRVVLPLPDLRSRRISLSLPRALAVAAALVAVTATAAWWWTSQPSRAISVGAGASAVGARRGAATLVAEDARYEATVAELRSAFEQRRSELDSSTVRVVEMNLAIIDRAMDDARRALANDPSDPYLNEHLRRQMRRKVDLLRLATTASFRTRGESRS